jgi:antagonist of KipI
MTRPLRRPVLEVRKAGLLDSVQDLGRPGQAAIALSRGGAMDRGAFTLANALVGNPASAAGLEITGPGPTVCVHCDTWMASVGADHGVSASDGQSGSRFIPMKTQRPVFVRAGSVLRWHAPQTGWRSWLAVAGGLDMPQVMGSRSAHLAAGIGPQRIMAGQALALAEDAEALAHARAQCVLGPLEEAVVGQGPRWQVAGDLPRTWPVIDLPVLAGRHLQDLSEGARERLLSQAWKVSAQSNRQGLRLQGEPIETSGLPQLASEPVCFGTVQLPPGGEPVILLAEHQTTGGYPRVLEVASAAEGLLAQAGAGCLIRFRLIGLDEADALAQQQARLLRQRLIGIEQACRYPIT